MPNDASWSDLWAASADGLRLYARDYGSGARGGLPVVCLPGLARTSADFHELASSLALDPGDRRRVLALDCRGRGRSDRDPDPARYVLPIECADIQVVLAAAGIDRAVFVGTSRGGMQIMMLGTLRPDLVAGAVLNDIGPTIELGGLIRIKGYVGRLQQPRGYAQAAETVRALMSPTFPNFGPADWDRLARRGFVESADGLAANYDPALSATLATLTPETKLPSLWPLFDSLKAAPLLAVRGALSDILSPQTLAAMAEHHPGMEMLTIADQGHAPVLWEDDVIARIADFVRRVT